MDFLSLFQQLMSDSGSHHSVSLFRVLLRLEFETFPALTSGCPPHQALFKSCSKTSNYTQTHWSVCLPPTLLPPAQVSLQEWFGSGKVPPALIGKFAGSPIAKKIGKMWRERFILDLCVLPWFNKFLNQTELGWMLPFAFLRSVVRLFAFISKLFDLDFRANDGSLRSEYFEVLIQLVSVICFEFSFSWSVDCCQEGMFTQWSDVLWMIGWLVLITWIFQSLILNHILLQFGFF